MTVSSGHGHQKHGPRRNPRFWVIVGGPLSVAAGLLLATVAFFGMALFGGSLVKGGYCSVNGNIGRYETSAPGKVVGYLDQGWSGFPPAQSCSVLLLEATNRNPPLSVEERLRREPAPHHLLAHGSYPGSQGRQWIVGLLLLPPAIWCLLVVGSAFRKWRTDAARRKQAPTK